MYGTSIPFRTVSAQPHEPRHPFDRGAPHGDTAGNPGGNERFSRNLTWNDFHPVANSLSPPAQAQTGARWSTTGWSVRVANGEYRVHGARVNVSLNPHNTWAVPGARTSAALLRHEQGHYDIAGLIARDLIRKILDLSLDVVVDRKSTRLNSSHT